MVAEGCWICGRRVLAWAVCSRPPGGCPYHSHARPARERQVGSCHAPSCCVEVLTQHLVWLVSFSLRRRFEQNQQDISFTIMALLPTLGRHILEGMDVEGVTCELQSYSRSAKAPSQVPPAPAAPSESSLSSSVELVSQPQHPDHSGNSSFSMLQSVKENGVETPTDLSTSSASWVDQLSSVQLSEVANGHAPEPVTNGTGLQMPLLGIDPPLSDSVISTSTSSSSSVAADAVGGFSDFNVQLW